MKEGQLPRVPQIAYEPEGHGIAVLKQQALDLWREIPGRFWFKASATEEDLEWYLLHYYPSVRSNPPSIAKLLKLDSDPSLVDSLREGQFLSVIYWPEARPDICFGREEQIIAAVLIYDNKPIYRDPIFDLDYYLESRSLH